MGVVSGAGRGGDGRGEWGGAGWRWGVVSGAGRGGDGRGEWGGAGVEMAALHIKHLKPLARGASKKRTSLAPTKPTGPKVLGQRNTTSTESQDAIVRLYDTFIRFSAAGGHIALRQHIALLLVRHQSADCPRGTHAVWPGRRARSPDPHHRCTAWAS